MTVIPLGAGLPRRSSHLPANLSEPLIARRNRAYSIRLFGVAPGGGYRVSPAAPSCATNSRLAPLLGREDTATRLCGPIPRLRQRQAFDYYVRPLAVTLLCGARTFLSVPIKGTQRPPGRLHASILASAPLADLPHRGERSRSRRRRPDSGYLFLPLRGEEALSLRPFRDSCLPRSSSRSSACRRPGRNCCASS